MEIPKIVLDRIRVSVSSEGVETVTVIEAEAQEFIEESTGDFGELIAVNPGEVIEVLEHEEEEDQQEIIDELQQEQEITDQLQQEQEITDQLQQEQEITDQDHLQQEQEEQHLVQDSLEVIELKKRVEQLEQEVDNLHNQLRLMKRKMRSYDPNAEGYQEELEKTILRVLDSQHWTMSRLIQRRPGRPSKMTKLNPTRDQRGQKRTAEYIYSEEEEDKDAGIGMVDDEYGDPTYRYGHTDSENVKPKPTSKSQPQRTKAPPGRKRGRGRPPTNQRRVVIVKKVEPASPPPETEYDDGIEYRDFGEYALQAPEKSKDKVIRAGDVSVILEDEEEEQQLEKYDYVKSPTKRIRKSGEPNSRPKVVKCSLCPKMFRDQHDVTRHERTHTGEKPFFCDVCGPNMRFTQTYHLQRHKTKYHLSEMDMDMVANT